MNVKDWGGNANVVVNSLTGEVMERRIGDTWIKETDYQTIYWQGYEDGESSAGHDWWHPLSQVLPDRGPDWAWTPQAVADFIKAEMERNQ